MSANFDIHDGNNSGLPSGMSRFRNVASLTSWLDGRARAHRFVVERIPFSNLDQWFFEDNGDLAHRSGKYFRIEGLSVRTSFGSVPHWHQPIINQPEVGILGIITRAIDGELCFLMQAKMEPGNPNGLQLSPTVQATKSNYTQVHKGSVPTYLEYFTDRHRSNVVIDQLQTEQGGRFLRKRNRNMIIEVDGDLPPHPDFCWVTRGQLKALLRLDNVINMDARSVLSALPLYELRRDGLAPPSTDPYGRRLLRSIHEPERAIAHVDDILSWLAETRTRFELEVDRIGLKEVPRWHRFEDRIAHETGRFFSVIAVAVEAHSREVARWTQPLLADPALGVIGFIMQEHNAVLHFLIQAKVEPGNANVVDIAPTVCCSDADRRVREGCAPPFLELMLAAPESSVRHRSILSEDGGRFFHYQSRYMAVEIEAGTALAIPNNYFWVTAGQLLELWRFGYLNIETRSLLAVLGIP